MKLILLLGTLSLSFIANAIDCNHLNFEMGVAQPITACFDEDEGQDFEDMSFSVRLFADQSILHFYDAQSNCLKDFKVKSVGLVGGEENDPARNIFHSGTVSFDEKKRLKFEFFLSNKKSKLSYIQIEKGQREWIKQLENNGEVIEKKIYCETLID